MELSFGGPYQFTRSGLVVSGDSSHEQWEKCGEGLKAVDEARQWAIGDWLNDGKRHYGDGLYKRAAEITGLTEDSLRGFASMASRFELCLRKHNLSFQHHKEVQSQIDYQRREGQSLPV
ncbi:MAG: hypothetical protein FJ267_11280 [Planctomycetes bacterium]|nr:hypothetical protein [Planctomycetota bacterium]